MKKSAPTTNVFNYLDYRKFLRDYYNEQKSKRPAFTYSFFARKAGFNSKGLYKDVVDGRRKLGPRMTGKFIQAIGFSIEEADYFENMVLFNNAQTENERKKFLNRMFAISPLKSHVLDSNKYDYYSNWWCSAIFAFILYAKARNNFKSIAESFVPAISPEQVCNAIATLEKLNMIKMNKRGYYQACESFVATGEINSLANVGVSSIINYQKKVIQLAIDALGGFDFDHMSMRTLTLAISRSTYEELKKEAAQLWRKAAIMAEKDKKADRVYQFNMQLFPLTKICE